MSETLKHMYEHRDLTALLIKDRGIHEGHWAVVLEFTMGATMASPMGEEPMPTGMVSIRRIGIQQADAKSPNAVDAAVANPKPKATKPVAKKRATKLK